MTPPVPHRRTSPQPQRIRQARSAIAVLLVTAAAGAFFGVAASNARMKGMSFELDLADLVGEQQRVVAGLEEEVAGLQGETDDLLAGRLPGDPTATSPASDRREFVGPAVVVSLDDSPAEFQLDESTNVNVAVVHQQDVDAVMNALWRGGADLMSVQGVRITSTTPVRCIGNVILVGARSFAPPYKITAIGDVEGMVQTLDEDPSVTLYREDVVRYQLGWDVQVVDEATIPAASQPAPLKFAQVERGA